jgi:predicted peroxiredoxin
MNYLYVMPWDAWIIEIAVCCCPDFFTCRIASTKIEKRRNNMMRCMKYTAALSVLLIMVVMSLPSHATDDETKGLFVVVTTPDAQTQMMAMVLSTQTVKQGKSVHMLLCGPGGELAVKNSEQTMIKPLNKSPQMLLLGLIKSGVKVEMCPLFLPNKDAGNGADASILIDGVSIAQPPVVAEKLRKEGIKLFTF